MHSSALTGTATNSSVEAFWSHAYREHRCPRAHGRLQLNGCCIRYAQIEAPTLGRMTSKPYALHSECKVLCTTFIAISTCLVALSPERMLHVTATTPSQCRHHFVADVFWLARTVAHRRQTCRLRCPQAHGPVQCRSNQCHLLCVGSVNTLPTHDC